MSRPSPPAGSRVVPKFRDLAVSREDQLWRLVSSEWVPVDLDASGMRRYMATLVRLAFPYRPPWWPGPAPALDRWSPQARRERWAKRQKALQEGLAR